jgi:hypothetical protein
MQLISVGRASQMFLPHFLLNKDSREYAEFLIMTRSGISSSLGALILGSLLVAYPLAATAQRHGGGNAGGGGINGSVSGSNRPTGLDEKDSLRDFHQVMAVQATSQQTAEFQALIKMTDAAKAELQILIQRLQKETPPADSLHRQPIDQALEAARAGNKNFEQGFSPAQKAGLKEIARRLAKADSDLEQEEKKLDQSLDLKADDLKSATADLAARAESLDKALTNFYNQQLALGREMSITLANGQDQAFTLPSASHTVSIANQTIAVPVSGSLAQIAAQGGMRTFKLALSADLTGLQQNITELLRSQLDSSDNCGERLAVRQVALTPATPAGLLMMKLHFERWTCSRMFGQSSANELAEGDGAVEIKLTASVEKPNTLKIAASFGRIDATGMMAEELRSGSLGENLRNTVAQSVLAAAQTGSDFKLTLPPAVQSSAVIQAVHFQDTGVGGLSLELDGQLEISNEQADLLAGQLNQALSAQGTALR